MDRKLRRLPHFETIYPLPILGIDAVLDDVHIHVQSRLPAQDAAHNHTIIFLTLMPTERCHDPLLLTSG